MPRWCAATSALPARANAVFIGNGAEEPTAPLDAHNDHRIAMALSVLCAKTGGTIRGAEAVKKSFPDYFEVLKSAGIRMDVEDEMDI